MEPASGWRSQNQQSMRTAGESGSRARPAKAQPSMWCCPGTCRSCVLLESALSRECEDKKEPQISPILQILMRLLNPPGLKSDLSACNGGHDADFIARFHGSLGFFQKTDIFVVQKDINEPADVILFVTDALFQTGVIVFQTIDDLTDCCAFELQQPPGSG